ncbi:MAG: sodium:solute symporter family transporter [Candidatus Muiribacteriota bacterium]
MSTANMAWIAIILYIVVTVILTIRGNLKTKSLKGYAVGNKDIPPVLVGISLSAQLTSVATFVTNPGLIYDYGLSALAGFGIAAALGITTGLFLFSKPFLNMGNKISAVTIPQWIGKRYNSIKMQLLFAFISLTLIAFAVLIVVAVSMSLGQLIDIPAYTSAGEYNPDFIKVVVALVIFVFLYMMIGGVNTHAYTNSIQGIIMFFVALLLIGSGIPLFFAEKGLLSRVGEINPSLVSIINPSSLYFRNFFEVFICNFIVGLAIVCQPHIIGKVLYLKNEKQIKSYLSTAIIAGFVFALVMITGFYAIVTVPGIPQSDMVIPTYIGATFSPFLQVIITLGIVCAGLSTLEGILLSLSAIFSIDMFKPFLKYVKKEKDENQINRKALTLGRIALVIAAIIIIILSTAQVKNPAGGSVVIFAMYGIYLLFSASFFPIAAGMFFKNLKTPTIFTGIIISIVVYISFFGFKVTYMANNPAFLATCAIISGWLAIFIHHFIKSKTS